MCEHKDREALWLEFLFVDNHLVFYSLDEEEKFVRMYNNVCSKKELKNRLKKYIGAVGYRYKVVISVLYLLLRFLLSEFYQAMWYCIASV